MAKEPEDSGYEIIKVIAFRKCEAVLQKSKATEVNTK